ncbi:hypothetical protein ACC702_03470 [Rhizobium ruizarguesonis]
MTPDQQALVVKAITDLRIIVLASSEDGDLGILNDVLEAAGIQKGFINYRDGSATGYSPEGHSALSDLARSYRLQHAGRSQRASNATLVQLLAAAVATRWRDDPGRTPTSRDFDAMDAAVDEWFGSLTQTYLHAVPCIISSYHAPPFKIGPVHFYAWQDFPTERFGVAREDFWEPKELASENLKLGGVHFGSLVKMATERFARWVAVVEINGRAQKESREAADLAVDIALGVLQIAAPGLHIRNISRATAAAPAIWRADVTSNGSWPTQAVSNFEPARLIDPLLFADVITKKIAEPLEMMGQLLDDYLGTASNLPRLTESWCNGVYWFHRALAEDLDTVAVFMLETAIEVLLRAEDMARSKSRIKASFETFFNLAGSDIFPGHTLTVDQFILNVTTARSRVAHGTWPTLQYDLPGYKKQKPLERATLEGVALQLFIVFAAWLAEYGKAGETGDETDAFLIWIKSHSAGAASQAPTA